MLVPARMAINIHSKGENVIHINNEEKSYKAWRAVWIASQFCDSCKIKLSEMLEWSLPEQQMSQKWTPHSIRWWLDIATVEPVWKLNLCIAKIILAIISWASQDRKCCSDHTPKYLAEPTCFKVAQSNNINRFRTKEHTKQFRHIQP